MNTPRYTSIYGSNNASAIPQRSVVQFPSSPAGATVSIDVTQLGGPSGILTPVYNPGAEMNTIIVPGVTGGANVTIQIAQWGTGQYSYPTSVGDTLRFIVLGDATVGFGLGFFYYQSSPSVFPISYYSIMDFVYLGDGLESSVGTNGGWALTFANCDGIVYNS